MAEIENKQDVANGGGAASGKSTFMTILPFVVVVGVIAAIVGVAVAIAGSGDDDNGVRELNAVTFLNACEGIEAQLGDQNDVVGISTCIDEQAALCLFNGQEPTLELENCAAQARVCRCARGNGLGKLFRERDNVGNREGALGLCTLEDSDDDDCSEISDGSDFFSDTSDNSDSEDEDGLEAAELLQQICELPKIVDEAQNLDVFELLNIDFFEALEEALDINLEDIFGEDFDADNVDVYNLNPEDFGVDVEDGIDFDFEVDDIDIDVDDNDEVIEIDIDIDINDFFNLIFAQIILLFGENLPEGFEIPEDFEFDLDIPPPIEPDFEAPENFEFDFDFGDAVFPPGFNINDFLPDPADFDAAFPDGIAPDFNEGDFTFCLNDEILFSCENTVGRVIDCDRRNTNACNQTVEGNIVVEALCVELEDTSSEDDDSSDSESDLEETTDTDTDNENAGDENQDDAGDENQDDAGQENQDDAGQENQDAADNNEDNTP